MKRRFSDEQIIGMIKEHEAGVKAQELCREYGISDATFYKYKSKFGGMNVSDAKRLRALEHENVQLKKALAEAVLANQVLKEINTNIKRPLDSYAADWDPDGRDTAQAHASTPAARSSATLASS